MITITSYPVAVVMCVITMICWGSWGNTQKLASKEWKFQLFYWDYALGILLFSLLMAFTAGSMGDGGRAFVQDLKQGEWSLIGSAILGGVVFNISNILLVIAIDIAGLALAFPVGVGLALVIGVVQNFNPDKDPLWMIASGVSLIVLAIILNAAAFALKNGAQGGKKVVKGIIISVLAGSLMGLFYSFVAAAMSEVKEVGGAVALEAGKMSSYTVMVLFALGIFLSNFVFNTFIMKCPIEGEKVPLLDYFKKGTVWLHFVGILGGAIWCLGTSLNFLAATVAGVALAWGLGQGATMVSAFWGVFVWKEFKGADGIIPEGSRFYLAGKISAPSPEKVAEGLNRVFMQDSYTQITCKISSLENAYLCIPQMGNPELQLGVQTKANWFFSSSYVVLG